MLVIPIYIPAIAALVLLGAIVALWRRRKKTLAGLLLVPAYASFAAAVSFTWNLTASTAPTIERFLFVFAVFVLAGASVLIVVTTRNR